MNTKGTLIRSGRNFCSLCISSFVLAFTLSSAKATEMLLSRRRKTLQEGDRGYGRGSGKTKGCRQPPHAGKAQHRKFVAYKRTRQELQRTNSDHENYLTNTKPQLRNDLRKNIPEASRNTGYTSNVEQSQTHAERKLYTVELTERFEKLSASPKKRNNMRQSPAEDMHGNKCCTQQHSYKISCIDEQHATRMHYSSGKAQARAL